MDSEDNKSSKHYSRGYEKGVIEGIWKGRKKERKELVDMINLALSSPAVSEVSGVVALTLLRQSLEGIQRQVILEQRQERKLYRKNANLYTNRQR